MIISKYCENLKITHENILRAPTDNNRLIYKDWYNAHFAHDITSIYSKNIFFKIGTSFSLQRCPLEPF